MILNVSKCESNYMWKVTNLIQNLSYCVQTMRTATTIIFIINEAYKGNIIFLYLC